MRSALYKTNTQQNEVIGYSVVIYKFIDSNKAASVV